MLHSADVPSTVIEVMPNLITGYGISFVIQDDSVRAAMASNAILFKIIIKND